jgi:hypothetical protein
MATVTQRVASIDNGGAFIEMTFDDQTEIVTRIAWANNIDRPVLVWFTHPVSGRVLDVTLQPGASGSRNFSGNQRFNRADNWGFNLAT